MVVSAQHATIFGVHLDDKLLFSHQPVPLHVAIVIPLTVVISATTTFMTVRQSSKRGLMKTNVDPDNPMAQSQKYMMYIVPFFSLTGLVLAVRPGPLLGDDEPVDAGPAVLHVQELDDRAGRRRGGAAGATTGGPVGPPQSSLRPGSGSSGPVQPRRHGSAGSRRQARPAARGPARQPAARGRIDGRRARTGHGQRANGGRSGRSGSARPKGGMAAGSGRTSNGSGAARTGSASASHHGARPSPAERQEKRGLLRLGRAKPEPEPQDEVPTAKVVRQQPVRQAKSKRSGKR